MLRRERLAVGQRDGDIFGELGLMGHTENEGGLRELALFAGAGGGILGGYLLGWRTVCAVEIEDYPRRVLLARQRDGILPRFPVWDDVTTFDGTEWRGRVDVVSGGFPCQDISCAGKGAGLDGARSGLWAEFARIIGEVQPAFVWVENSPMLLVRGIGRVLWDLAAMGYDARWGVLGAGDAGGLHERNRIWILGFADHRKERIQGFQPKKVQAQPAFSWCQNVRRSEDLRVRPDLPESVLLRTQHDVAHYVDRISAIGNGQVPAVAALAWNVLSKGLKHGHS